MFVILCLFSLVACQNIILYDVPSYRRNYSTKLASRIPANNICTTFTYQNNEMSAIGDCTTKILTVFSDNNCTDTAFSQSRNYNTISCKVSIYTGDVVGGLYYDFSCGASNILLVNVTLVLLALLVV